MLVGAHVSIAGGLDKAIGRGEAIGCTAIQTFASSPRTIHFSAQSPETIAAYLSAKRASSITRHVFHGVYLINLAHENKDYVTLCEASLVNYQTLAGKIGALGTVFHIGSHKGAGMEAVIDQVAESITHVLAQTPEKVMLLLENAAGQKGTIGRSIEELAQVMETVEKKGGETKKLGVGIDTQHAFASGYAIDTDDGLTDFMTKIDAKIGFDKVKLLHVNDSKTAFGSHRDRHENLGEGTMGLINLQRIVTHPKFKDLPLILEVPGENKKGPGKKDVDALKHIASS